MEESHLLRQPPTEEEATFPPETIVETHASPRPVSGSVQDQELLASPPSADFQEASSHPTPPIAQPLGEGPPAPVFQTSEVLYAQMQHLSPT